jgi:hypothetical protein
MQKIHQVLILAIMGGLLSAGAAIAQYGPETDDLSVLPVTKDINAGTLTDKFLTAAENPIYFPLKLPNRTNTQFSKVSFSFTDANLESGVAPIQFDLEQLQAFIGTPDQLGAAVAIKSSWIDETGTVWLEFDQALAATTKVTIMLKTKTLPPTDTYGYSIAAYSATQPPRAIFVEDGTLTVNP